jgi:ubiquinone/menaquinone biosynthesis C-methylase UbiE
MLVKHFLDTVLKILAPLPVRTVLDVGCGEGFLMKTLEQHYPHLVMSGVDICEEALSYTRHINRKAYFVVGDVYSIPMKTHSYDLVLCTEVIEHLSKPLEALQEIKRISKRYCLLSVPNEPFFRGLSLLKGNYIRRLGKHPEHIHTFSSTQFLQLLDGFMVRELKKPFPWTVVLCEVT